MSITVRFPGGLAVTYNTATRIDYLPGGTMARLQTDVTGAWVADISLAGGPIFEAMSPCRVEMETKPSALAEVIEEQMALRKSINSVKRALGKK